MTLTDIKLRVTPKNRDRAARFAELITRLAAGFVLSGASILGGGTNPGIAPFAAAFAASSGAGWNGLFALFGASAGYLIFLPFIPALQYTSMTLIVVAAAVVFRDTEMYRAKWFMPAAAGAASLFVGFLAFCDGGWSVGELILIGSDATLALGCTYFYKTALSPWSGRLNLEGETIHTVAVLILVSTALISLANVEIFGVLSVGRSAAALAVFLAAYKGGAGMGCAAGVAVGLAMDAAGGGMPVFAAAFGLCGLVAGVFSGRSRLIFALAFVLVDAGAAAVAFQTSAVPMILYEVFLASIVFILLPASTVSRLSALLPEHMRGGGAVRAREYTRRRVEQAARAFSELYDAAQSASESVVDTDNHAVIFSRAAEDACRRCAAANRCWQENYNATRDVMNNITPVILRRGRLEEADFPQHFAEACANLDGYIAAVNYELRALLFRRQLKNRLRGTIDTAMNRYSEVSEILKNISSELGQGIQLEPELETKMRKYLQSQGYMTEVAVFRDLGGRLRAELSGAEINAFTRDRAWLDKLSVVLGVRLCVPEGRPRSGRLELLEAEPLAATIGVSRMSRREGDICGDTGAYFKTDEGVLYVVLSDGMGAGEDAAKISSDAVRILEKFICAGVAPETSVRMLSDIMLFRNESETGCATVDLACVNLFSGEVRLLKYGAAPSYAKTGGTVKRVEGHSFAAGLAGAKDAPDDTKMTLKPGAFAVIVSDGAVAGADDSALVRIISEFAGDEPRELTRAIVEAAKASGAADDDVTAIAIKITERD
ncbi:MAG: serine/threonine-protein phosphatase [Oscillospiraceae bacterium]|jgi:stage II sporulation protein E|nr:serine/threonine-protein phosphatase [Oscillospiraceae bacterium]